MVPQFSVDCQGVWRWLVYPLVAPRGTAAHVHHRSGHRARFSIQILAKIFLWSLSVVLITVSLFCAVGGASRRYFFGRALDRSLLTFPTCRSGFVVHFCLILGFFFASSVPL